MQPTTAIDKQEDGFESYTFESPDDRGQWEPQGEVSPDTAPDVTYLPSDHTQNPSTVVPGPTVPRRDTDVKMALPPNYVREECADNLNLRYITNLDNTTARQIAPWSPYRKRLRLDWVSTTNVILIGRKTALDNFAGIALAGITPPASISGGGVFALNPLAAGTNTRAYMDIFAKAELWALGLCAANSGLCKVQVLDETYTTQGWPQIG